MGMQLTKKGVGPLGFQTGFQGPATSILPFLKRPFGVHGTFNLPMNLLWMPELRGDLRDPADAEAELCAADQPEPGPLLPHLDGQEDEGVDGGDTETHHRGTG